MALCKGSAIYICLIDPKLLGHLFLSISLAHAKIQLTLPSKYSSAIFQSSCLWEVIVKEVQAMDIQMSCNFERSFQWSSNDSPPNMSSCNSSMRAHLQILVFGQIFSLWSNYILYCFILRENLPGHSPTQITSLNKFWHQCFKPIFL